MGEARNWYFNSLGATEWYQTYFISWNVILVTNIIVEDFTILYNS